MIETREKIINESVYSVTQMPARRAIRLKAKLFKQFGAGITQFLLNYDERKKDKNNQNVNPALHSVLQEENLRSSILKNDCYVKAIKMISESLDEKQFDELLMEILQGVRKGGVELTREIVDQQFAGELLTLYQVILFVLEVNYGDFFGMTNIGSLSEEFNQQETKQKKTYTY